MKYLSLSELEKQAKDRDIRTSFEEARKAGLLPKSKRIARKSGGPGSEPAYDAKILDYLSVIDGLRAEGYPLNVIRQKLADLIKSQSEIEQKKKAVKDILKKALDTQAGDERVRLVAKALTEVDDVEIDEFLLLEKELGMFDNPESKLRHLLGQNLPERLKRGWRR